MVAVSASARVFDGNVCVFTAQRMLRAGSFFPFVRVVDGNVRVLAARRVVSDARNDVGNQDLVRSLQSIPAVFVDWSGNLRNRSE